MLEPGGPKNDAGVLLGGMTAPIPSLKLLRRGLASAPLVFVLACSGEGLDAPTSQDPSAGGGGSGASSTGGGAPAGGTGGSTGGVSPSTGGNPGGGNGGSGGGQGGATGGTSGGVVGTGGASGGGGGKATGGASSGGSTMQNGGGGFGGMLGEGGKAGPGGMAGSGMGGSAGGAETGGSGGEDGGSGGDSSPGPWTDGYVATMYGDINSGDCTAYSGSFTDHTPISTYTCVQGTGPRKVSLSSYNTNQANNASYYAALGDLSSLWQANGNASPCSCNGSTTATCGGPSCPDEISSNGSCGLCIAVRCDPDSSFRDDQGFSHNSNCNSTTYVVVQNIDACPHNHTTNVSSGAGWCTDRQAEHIDLSCSGLGDISNLGTNVGQAGWLPVSVQVVDCSVGLGPHSL